MDKERQFLGTYFDRNAVIRWSRVIQILAWVIAGIYATDLLVGTTVMVLQYARGFMVMQGPTDLMQQALYVIERPVHGILYFALLQALSKGLLIALDMEENTRRAARP
ncbi:MAG TPA: hypothetical protein VFH29_08750 [Anaerolineales bacterium]|nr:hypothetical protein [Anaerolineales bacterium]